MIVYQKNGCRSPSHCSGFTVLACPFFHLTNIYGAAGRGCRERLLLSGSFQSSQSQRYSGPEFPPGWHKRLDFCPRWYVLSPNKVVIYFWIWATEIGVFDHLFSDRGVVSMSGTGPHDRGMQLSLHKNVAAGRANRTTIPEFASFLSCLRKLILTHMHSSYI